MQCVNWPKLEAFKRIQDGQAIVSRGQLKFTKGKEYISRGREMAIAGVVEQARGLNMIASGERIFANSTLDASGDSFMLAIPNPDFYPGHPHPANRYVDTRHGPLMQQQPLPDSSTALQHAHAQATSTFLQLHGIPPDTPSHPLPERESTTSTIPKISWLPEPNIPGNPFDL